VETERQTWKNLRAIPKVTSIAKMEILEIAKIGHKYMYFNQMLFLLPTI
jgi:hypothetical protein